MKRFVIKTIFVSLPILVVAILIEFLLRAAPNDYLLKKNYLDKKSAAVETLILGNSHSFYGLNPQYFSTTTFNASHISQSLNYDFEILKKYQNKLKKLKTIVLPISYFTLFSKLEVGSESWRVKNYIIYYDMNSSNSFTDYSEVLNNRMNVNGKRLISYYLLGKSIISCTDLGWGKDYNSENSKDLSETGKTAAQRHSKDELNFEGNKEILRDNILILRSIINWCKDHNVKIVLMMPPAFETYRNYLNHEQLKISLNITKEMCSKYGNCIFLDLLNDSNFKAIDFYDADHLSEIGAKKLSELINKKIGD
jgi:hypothetical protein